MDFITAVREGTLQGYEIKRESVEYDMLGFGGFSPSYDEYDKRYYCYWDDLSEEDILATDWKIIEE